MKTEITENPLQGTVVTFKEKRRAESWCEGLDRVSPTMQLQGGIDTNSEEVRKKSIPIYLWHITNCWRKAFENNVDYAKFSSMSTMNPESREVEDSEGAIPWKRARGLVEKGVDAHCGEVDSSIITFMGEIVGKGEKKRTCDDI